MKLSPKHRPKIDKLRVKPPTGYNWENGDIAFGKKEDERNVKKYLHMKK